MRGGPHGAKTRWAVSPSASPPRSSSIVSFDLSRVGGFRQSRFAAVMTTAEWMATLDSGLAPERDSIFGSYRKALEGR